MHLTRVSNVSQIKVDSNVVTEYTGPHDRPLRKYPEVAILGGQSGLSGGYTQDGYTVEASSEFSAIHAASNVFNHIQAYQTTDHAWLSGTNTYGLTDGLASSGTSKDTFQDVDGSWLGITLPTGIRLSHIHIYNRFDNANSVRPPKTGIIWASNDGTSWYNIFNFDNLQDTDGTLNVLHVNNTNFYTRYRVQITAMHNDPQKTSVAVGELEFYGHEEGSGSLDTTLKSVYNVPATTGTQLEVYYDGQDYTDMPTVGSASVTDKAGGDQTGTPSSGVSFDSTYKAFVFDGTANGKIVGTHNLSGTAPVNTCSAWFKKTSSTGDYSYISRFGTNATSSQIAISIDERTSTLNKLRFEIYGGSTALESELTITENVWYHVVGVYSGGTWNTNNCKMYLNGVEISLTNGTNTTTTPSIADNTLVLGSNGGPSNWDLAGSIANFRLYSKALNADQVKELYDYQKDYFLGSKSQVTLYKGHLGVGVTEPSGQLELAGDERIQQYPPRGMTHPDGTATGTHTIDVTKNITYIEGHGEFKASASLRSRQDVDYDGQQPYNAFDYTTNSYLLYGPGSGEDVGYNKTTGYYEDNEYRLSASSGTPYGHWLQLEMPYKINVKSYFIQHVADDSWPQDWQIWASNDDISWTHIHTYTGGTFDTNPQYYTVSHTGHYKMYTMIITRIKEGSSFDRVRIQELRYFGTPGPTTLDKGSLTLGRSLDVPRISRYDVDTETPRPEKLVVDFDTTVNSSPTDISGQGNHGTLVGATYSPADKAFSFDGGDYIQGSLTNSSSNFTNTVSLWFKMDDLQSTLGTPSTTGNRRTIFEFGDIGNRSGLNFGFVDIRDTYMTIYMGDTATLPSSAFAPQQNQWHHLVLMYSGSGTLRIFIDNTEYTSSLAGVVNGTLAIQVNADLLLGSEGRLNAAKFRGDISNFKVYSVALEPSEVQKLYRLGRTGRSMVISDTAVGIGKVPEAQLDVRGTANFGSRVGIGTTNPNYALDVTGEIYASGDVIMFSDERKKTNIEVIPNALEKVLQLRGVTFEKLDDGNRRHAGIIAQEVEKVLPEVVYTAEDGTKSVAYGNLVGLLIEAIKELVEK
jgi:hypothetical protein